MKTALLTGPTGQDGSYLADLLLESGYQVHGIKRRSSSFNTARVDHLMDNPNFHLHYGDLTDGTSLRRTLEKTQPTHVFHLGAQSQVRISFDMPEYTADVDALGTLRLLEAIRDVNKDIRFYNAASSELFGGVDCPAVGYDETSKFDPRSPYAAAKAFAYYTTVNYRDAYGIKAWNGILFNHESPRRGENFVTRKITRAVAAIKAGKQKELFLGNLDASRDWGYAPDYVRAMKMMLESDEPDDYVVATGTSFSVLDFLKYAFRGVGLDWEDFVRTDPRLFRPTEVSFLLGNPSKIKRKLHWEPEVDFYGLGRIMLQADLKEAGL